MNRFLDEDFDQVRVAQKAPWARRGTICAGLEYDDQIARHGVRKGHLVGQDVQWRTERPDNGNGFTQRCVGLVADGNRVILTDHLTKVAGSRQMMV